MQAKVVHILNAHLECPSTSAELGQYFMQCYYVTTLGMRTSKDADHSVLCCLLVFIRRDAKHFL